MEEALVLLEAEMYYEHEDVVKTANISEPIEYTVRLSRCHNKLMPHSIVSSCKVILSIGIFDKVLNRTSRV